MNLNPIALQASSLCINSKFKLCSKIGGGSQAWNQGDYHFTHTWSEVVVKLWHTEFGRALEREHCTYRSLAGGPDIPCLHWFRTDSSFHVITSCLEFIHRHNFIHLNIKPSNILISANLDPTNTYLIYFGHACHYQDNSFLPFVGTKPFVSVSAHLGIQFLRCDDLKSLTYILIYLLGAGTELIQDSKCQAFPCYTSV
ncbi:hypothetical protein PAXRUDRAFT_36930 [Paxillus rubicundulus Ve08.2h10]|uniref:Protein kinase domain-containing protein n=1 Tax=Paxillus rubicundulus Ve08.2h10 TaxID=930991 RepID=A0A0D0D7L3_9AGAM|nr:hypothetical protein PAXRUDRAFT_36930 [Paxillus rubicundulus Ve08.2h10]